MKKMVNFTPSVFEGFFGTSLNNIPLLELQHFGMLVHLKIWVGFLTHRFRRVSQMLEKRCSWTGARQDPKATRWISWRIGGVLEISFKGREFSFFISCECPWNRNKKHLPKNWINLQIGRGWRGPYNSIVSVLRSFVTSPAKNRWGFFWKFGDSKLWSRFAIFFKHICSCWTWKIDQACKCRFELDY